MKRTLQSLFLSIAIVIVFWELGGCKRTPSPPTEQHAIGVWKTISQKPHLRDLEWFTATYPRV